MLQLIAGSNQGIGGYPQLSGQWGGQWRGPPRPPPQGNYQGHFPGEICKLILAYAQPPPSSFNALITFLVPVYHFLADNHLSPLPFGHFWAHP